MPRNCENVPKFVRIENTIINLEQVKFVEHQERTEDGENPSQMTVWFGNRTSMDFYCDAADALWFALCDWSYSVGNG
jgi:hypothetical protein